ncbi:unnamed protein product [Microthlaspi erraticum]|uniref:Uncharacterized protein n=1 Tax=Microthlaspi erraticum TaxID=1685480 RepID=A0A6D2J6F5_9BRAS|nr:unnamed protein product [Microthlaspi erraticum]
MGHIFKTKTTTQCFTISIFSAHFNCCSLAKVVQFQSLIFICINCLNNLVILGAIISANGAVKELRERRLCISKLQHQAGDGSSSLHLTGVDEGGERFKVEESEKSIFILHPYVPST